MSWDAYKGKWRVDARINNTKYAKTFENEEDAARHYDKIQVDNGRKAVNFA